MTAPSVSEQLAGFEGRIETLLAPVERDLAAYDGRPLDFITEVLGITPWSKQREIVEALERHRRVSVPGCVNSGKDYISAAYSLYWAYARGGLALLTAATLRQVLSILMANVGRFKRAAGLPGDLQKLSLAALGSGGILGLTSTEGSKLSGHHAPRGVLVVISEAQAFQDDAQIAGLLSCASSEQSRVLAVGNPIEPVGFFARISRPDSGWRVVQISAHEHPNVIEGREVIPGAIDRRYIEDTARDFGEQSSIYLSRVLGEFPDSAVENGLFTRGDLTRPVAMAGGGVDAETVLGIDVGAGVDESVVCVRRGFRVEGFVTWNVRDTAATVERVQEVAVRWGVRPKQDRAAFALPPLGAKGLLRVDANGIGAGVADALRRAGYRVDAVLSQMTVEHAAGIRRHVDERSPTYPGVQFANVRAAMYWRVRDLVQRGALALPPDERLAEELLATGYLETASGKVALVPKEDVKRRIGRSPDRADALALACWESPIRYSALGAAGEW